MAARLRPNRRCGHRGSQYFDALAREGRPDHLWNPQGEIDSKSLIKRMRGRRKHALDGLSQPVLDDQLTHRWLIQCLSLVGCEQAQPAQMPLKRGASSTREQPFPDIASPESGSQPGSGGKRARTGKTMQPVNGSYRQMAVTTAKCFVVT